MCKALTETHRSPCCSEGIDKRYWVLVDLSKGWAQAIRLAMGRHRRYHVTAKAHCKQPSFRLTANYLQENPLLRCATIIPIFHIWKLSLYEPTQLTHLRRSRSVLKLGFSDAGLILKTSEYHQSKTSTLNRKSNKISSSSDSRILLLVLIPSHSLCGCICVPTHACA